MLRGRDGWLSQASTSRNIRTPAYEDSYSGTDRSRCSTRGWRRPADAAKTAVASAAIGRIVVGMQGDQPQVVAFPVGNGAATLTQTDRVCLGPVGSLNVVDGFPMQPGVTVDALPVLGSEPPQRADHLAE